MRIYSPANTLALKKIISTTTLTVALVLSGNAIAQNDSGFKIDRDTLTVKTFDMSEPLSGGMALEIELFETGLVVLRDDASITLSPGTRLNVEKYSRSTNTTWDELVLELVEGAVRFDLPEGSNKLSLNFSNAVLELVSGSAVVQKISADEFRVSLVHGGPITMRRGGETLTLSEAGTYVDIGAEAGFANAPTRIDLAGLGEEYNIFFEASTSLGIQIDQELQEIDETDDDKPGVATGTGTSVTIIPGTPVTQVTPVTVVTPGTPVTSEPESIIRGESILGSLSTTGLSSGEIGNVSLPLEQAVPITQAPSEVRQISQPSNSDDPAIRIRDDRTVHIVLPQNAANHSYSVNEVNFPMESSDYKVGFFSFAQDVLLETLGALEPPLVPIDSSDEDYVSFVVSDMPDFRSNSDPEGSLYLVAIDKSELNQEGGAHRLEKTYRISCFDGGATTCATPANILEPNTGPSFTKDSSGFQLLYSGFEKFLLGEDGNLRRTFTPIFNDDYFFFLEDEYEEDGIETSRLFATGGIGTRDQTLAAPRLDRFALNAGLSVGPVRGFLRDEASVGISNLISTDLLVINPTVLGTSLALHADFGLLGERELQKSTFSITLGEVEYGTLDDKATVATSLTTIGSSSSAATAPTAIASEFASTAFGGGATESGFNANGSTNGYASYLVLQNFTGELRGGTESVIGGGDRTFSTVRLATATNDSETLDSGAVNKTLTGWVGGLSQSGSSIRMIERTETGSGDAVVDVSPLTITLNSDGQTTTVSANLALDSREGSVGPLESALGESVGDSAFIDEGRFATGNGDLALVTSKVLFSDATNNANSATGDIAELETFEHVQWGLFLGDINSGVEQEHVHLGTWVAGEKTPDSFLKEVGDAGSARATFTGHLVGNVFSDNNQYTTTGTYSNEWTFNENGTGSGNLTIGWDGENYSGNAKGDGANISGSFRGVAEDNSKAGELAGNFYGPQAEEQAGTFFINEQLDTKPSYVASGTFAATCKRPSNSCVSR